MKKLFLIIGAPGSGKTTDAELIAERHDDITHYSTGDMFRAEVASGSELGKEIDTYVSAGNLVPIAIVNPKTKPPKIHLFQPRSFFNHFNIK